MLWVPTKQVWYQPMHMYQALHSGKPTRNLKRRRLQVTASNGDHGSGGASTCTLAQHLVRIARTYVHMYLVQVPIQGSSTQPSNCFITGRATFLDDPSRLAQASPPNGKPETRKLTRFCAYSACFVVVGTICKESVVLILRLSQKHLAASATLGSAHEVFNVVSNYHKSLTQSKSDP